MMKKQESVNASVVDLFCGAGGLSFGFKQEGFYLSAGIDIEESFRFPYEYNNCAPFIRRDVRDFSGSEVNDLFIPKTTKILAGCAPCQPFSTYSQKRINSQWQLVSEFARIVSSSVPDIVTMENVPRLSRFRSGEVFNNFVSVLLDKGYHVWWKNVFAPDYGVPQSRTRLVLLASRVGEISLIPPTHHQSTYRTVRDAIGMMPAIDAGEIWPNDILHRSSTLNKKNLERIRNSVPGGTWRDWSSELVTTCHTKNSGSGYSSVYGRMEWGKPSPTITTQFYGFGNGRFGHPDQNRAISLREGALLQTFPRDYQFVQPGSDVVFKTIGKMIGNAVPVNLSKAIAHSIAKHLEERS